MDIIISSIGNTKSVVYLYNIELLTCLGLQMHGGCWVGVSLTKWEQIWTYILYYIIKSMIRRICKCPVTFCVRVGGGGDTRNSTRPCFTLTIIAYNNKAIRDGKYLARHMPVLGNVHPINIEHFDILSWRHFSARSSCYIISWYGYPRGSHETYFKEFVSPVFEIRHWIAIC